MRVALLTLVAWCSTSVADAHQGSHAAGTAGPSGWDLAALVALAVMAVLYAFGSWRMAQREARVRLAERVSFWTGWAAMVAAVAPPLDRATQVSFSLHMAQHELLMLFGAPLMVVGRPVVPWLWALPDRPRRAAAAVMQGTPASLTWRWMTAPLVAWAVHGIAVWVWHLPALYEEAVRNEAVHALQHATFVATAVLFWWGLVYGRYGRASYGASALYVFTTMVHTGVLGALFALSTSPYYAIYRDRAAIAGVDAAADQQLAGLYMWIPAGIVLTILGLALMLAWVSESDRRAVRKAMALVLPAVFFTSIGCAMPHEREARQLTGGDPYRGRERIVQYGCDSCHTIPGVPTADAHVGPPLTRVARRVYLAGHLENTPENMIRWIQHPRAFDEHTVMPEMGVSDRDSRDIAAYLYTLR